MVMRNRHDGANQPGWWDDLPPRVRARFTFPPTADQDTEPAPRPAEPARPRPTALDWVRELSRLALLFLAVAVANVLFLLLALSFIASGPVRPATPFAAPGR